MDRGSFPGRIAFGRVLDELVSTGATSVRCLDEPTRRQWLAVAKRVSYEPRQTVVRPGPREVRQELAVAAPTSLEDERASFLAHARGELQRWLERQLTSLRPYPFESELRFNEATLQRYTAGSLGITPHRDHVDYVNLVCTLNLSGHARFYVCADRARRDPVSFDAVPGTLILMRAPGLRGLRTRPFHGVDRVRETRHVLILRQRRS